MHRWVFLFCLAAPASASDFDAAALARAAEGGEPYAQLNLGAAYDRGIGVAPDPVLAERWYRRAAEQGVAEAQFNLGHWLATHGRAGEAVTWMSRAAHQELADAQYLLGVMYAEGWGVKRDEAQAVAWLRRAARQAHGDAEAYLAANFPRGRE